MKLKILQNKYNSLSKGKIFKYKTDIFTVKLHLYWEENVSCNYSAFEVKIDKNVSKTLRALALENSAALIVELLVRHKEIDIQKDLDSYDTKIKLFCDDAEKYGLEHHNDKKWFFKKYCW